VNGAAAVLVFARVIWAARIALVPPPVLADVTTALAGFYFAVLAARRAAHKENLALFLIGFGSESGAARLRVHIWRPRHDFFILAVPIGQGAERVTTRAHVPTMPMVSERFLMTVFCGPAA